MKSKSSLNLDKIARGLGAERRGPIAAQGGYFGAVQLAEEVKNRFQRPPGGGRATDPAWTERRLIPLASETLVHLEQLAASLREEHSLSIEPLQLAALLLEQATAAVDVEKAKQIAEAHRSA